MVERGPEKAGVGGSIPSLATIQILNEFSPLLQFPAAWVAECLNANRRGKWSSGAAIQA